MQNDSLEKIAEDIRNSELVNMYPNVTNPVPGDGNEKAEIVFIGEAPGKDEDLQGKPFVGRAGKLLNSMLEEVGLDRKDVYITNIVKCRPPENRDPTQEEKDKWFPFLIREINVIKPLLIATLGRHSMGNFLPGVSISIEHGRAKRSKGIWHKFQIYYPLYHPAVGLYNPSQKEVMLKDLAKVRPLIEKIKKENLYGS